LSLFPDRRHFRLALIGALAASLALGLAACGRKGPLDPPPGATPAAGKAAGTEPAIGPNGLPRAPKGPNKHIPLDNLLN